MLSEIRQKSETTRKSEFELLFCWNLWTKIQKCFDIPLVRPINRTAKDNEAIE